MLHTKQSYEKRALSSSPNMSGQVVPGVGAAVERLEAGASVHGEAILPSIYAFVPEFEAVYNAIQAQIIPPSLLSKDAKSCRFFNHVDAMREMNLLYTRKQSKAHCRETLVVIAYFERGVREAAKMELLIAENEVVRNFHPKKFAFEKADQFSKNVSQALNVLKRYARLF